MTRDELIGAVLSGIVAVSRDLTPGGTTPFHDTRLSRNQLDALFALTRAGGELTAGDLAAELSVTPGAVTQLVDVLKTHRLVEVASHPDDGRVRLVRLTPSARAHISVFETAAVVRMAPRFDSMTDGDLHILARTLGRLSKAIQ